MPDLRSGLKNSGLRFARYIGSGIDELTFYTVSTLRGWQRCNSYSNQDVDLQVLLELAQSEPNQFLDTLKTPALPAIEIQNQKMPAILRTVANTYRYTHLTFASEVHTGITNNDTVHAHHLYRPDHKNAPTLIYLHGWHNFDPALSMLAPLQLVKPLGYNLVLLELPHHMNRASPGTYSGELALTPNLPALMTTVKQAVSDTRSLIAWLQARGIEHLALEGQSLGGGLAAMVLAVENKIDCAILFVPAVEPPTSLWHSTYTLNLRKNLARQGLDEAATSVLLEHLRPVRYRPLINPERILVVAASGDRVAFHSGVAEFARSWQTNFVTIEWGHLTSHWHRSALAAMRPFLSKWLPSENQK